MRGLDATRVTSSLRGDDAKSTMGAGFPEEMRAACEAVRLAAELCRETQSVLRSNERVQKQDDSPVTVADFAAQAIVSERLRRAHPSIKLIAEETTESFRDGSEAGVELLRKVTDLVNKVLPAGEAMEPEAVADAIDRGASEGGPTGRHWILDPIDGTKGFINGRQYAIALALMEDGEVTGGVLGCPNMPWWDSNHLPLRRGDVLLKSFESAPYRSRSDSPSSLCSFVPLVHGCVHTLPCGRTSSEGRQRYPRRLRG